MTPTPEPEKLSDQETVSGPTEASHVLSRRCRDKEDQRAAQYQINYGMSRPGRRGPKGAGHRLGDRRLKEELHGRNATTTHTNNNSN